MKLLAFLCYLPPVFMVLLLLAISDEINAALSFGGKDAASTPQTGTQPHSDTAGPEISLS